MALLVKCRAQYFTESAVQMRPVDHDATHLVKAVKGLDLHPKAFTWVNVAGARVKIQETNKELAIGWFADWAAHHVLAHGTPVVLVPIPSSKTIVSSGDGFRTAVIANEIAKAAGDGVSVETVLRHVQAVPSSRESGGTRDARLIYPNLTVTRKISGRVILIDDVMTGGGHLKAAAWRLMDAGLNPQLAICCGRTEHAQLPDPFSVADTSIDLSGKP